MQQNQQKAIDCSSRFLMSLWDDSEGGFSFARDCPVTLNATAICVAALEFLNRLDKLSGAQMERISERILSCQKGTGEFVDPLFTQDAIATSNHDASYFIEETTTYCQQALHVLGLARPGRRDYPSSWLKPKTLIEYFESMDWSDPHLNSNRVMFVLSQFAHDIEVFDSQELSQVMDVALDWLDAKQDRKTGLWGGPRQVSLSAAMAATFHFSFYYFYRNRPLLFPERIIDSCLSLQKKDGLFSRNTEIGQTCLDYDALDLLAKASAATTYRAGDIEKCFIAAHAALWDLYNQNDGGFPNSKEKHVNNGLRAPLNGYYHTGMKICACDTSDSNVFSTWFRWLAIACCLPAKNSFPKREFVHRPLPWLGCHNEDAIRTSYDPFRGRASIPLRVVSKLSERSCIDNAVYRREGVTFLRSAMQCFSSKTISLRVRIKSGIEALLIVCIKGEGGNEKVHEIARAIIPSGESELYAILPKYQWHTLDLYCRHPSDLNIVSAEAYIKG